MMRTLVEVGGGKGIEYQCDCNSPARNWRYLDIWRILCRSYTFRIKGTYLNIWEKLCIHNEASFHNYLHDKKTNKNCVSQHNFWPHPQNRKLFIMPSKIKLCLFFNPIPIHYLPPPPFLHRFPEYTLLTSSRLSAFVPCTL